MSVLFTDTMTVYNYRRDPDTEKELWIRSVIKGVQWCHSRNELYLQGNVHTVTKVESITIDFQHTYGNKPYLPPQEYLSLSDTEACNYWTLHKGLDILLLGESDKDITCSADIQELKDKFQYVATVNSVSDNRNRQRLKNIKVVGK